MENDYKNRLRQALNDKLKTLNKTVEMGKHITGGQIEQYSLYGECMNHLYIKEIDDDSEKFLEQAIDLIDYQLNKQATFFETKLGFKV